MWCVALTARNAAAFLPLQGLHGGGRGRWTSLDRSSLGCGFSWCSGLSVAPEQYIFLCPLFTLLVHPSSLLLTLKICFSFSLPCRAVGRAPQLSTTSGSSLGYGYARGPGKIGAKSAPSSSASSLQENGSLAWDDGSGDVAAVLPPN